MCSRAEEVDTIMVDLEKANQVTPVFLCTYLIGSFVNVIIHVIKPRL